MALTRTSIFFSLVISVAFTSAPATAQYMYLDANGNGIHDAGDVVNPNGTGTTVDIYLITTLNADSSATYCTSDPSVPLDLVGYSLNLLATNGSATFSGFTSRVATFTVAFGEFNPGDGRYKNGFSASQVADALPAGGPHRLASLTITGTSGTPQVDIVPVLTGGMDQTFFSTPCLGADVTGVWFLGTDWLSVSGLGPSGEGNASPMAAVPVLVEIDEGQFTCLVGEFSDPDGVEALTIHVDGLPPGFRAIRGHEFEGRIQIRAYGILGASTPDDAVYDVVWSASDGRSTRQSQTTLSKRAHDQTAAPIQDRIEEVLRSGTMHGMPDRQVRSLGTRALPYLASTLRDERRKGYWSRAARAIGMIGDTTFFDTLRAFVWDRFRGQIDETTYMAVRSAQGGLAAMATVSPRVLDYLIRMSDPSAWDQLQWTVPRRSRSQVARSLSRGTLTAICYTDTEEASTFISALPVPVDEQEALLVRGVKRAHDRVRAKGFMKYLEQQELEVNGTRR